MTGAASVRKGLLLAAAGFTCWGLLSPGNAILLEQYPPMWMQMVRGGLAAVIMAAVIGRPGLHRAAVLVKRPEIAMTLLVGTFLSFGLFILSQTRIEAAFTTLGFYASPLWTAVLARFMLGERMGWAFVPTVLALLGGGYLALTGGGALPAPDALGLILAVASGATWGLYTVLLRKHAPSIPWKDLLLASLILGTIGFALVAAVTEPFPDITSFTAKTWLWTGIQVLVPTLAALAFFQTALQLAPAGRVSIMVGFELAATILFVWWLLGASFSAVQLGGVALVLLAVTGYLWHRDRSDRALPPIGPD